MTAPGSPPTVEQRCYRHADRRAGVTCQRCARPICPSCMVSASVGFQCPECSKQGAKQQRLVDVFRERRPTLTYVLIAVNAAVYVAGLGVAGTSSAFSSNSRMIVDYGLVGDLVGRGEWWRLITSGFLHGGLLHLGFNMYCLYAIGGFLERVVGPARYAAIYAVSLIGGSLGVVLLDPNALTVGASGAVFGIFGAFAVLEISRGANPLKTTVSSTILLNLFLTFAIPGISIGGHLGGLVAGGLVGAIFFGLNPQQARQRLGANQPALVGAALGLGVVLFAGSLIAAGAL